MENQRNKLLLIIRSLIKLIEKGYIIILEAILISVISKSSRHIIVPGYEVTLKSIIEKQLTMLQHQNNLTNTINSEWTAIQEGIRSSTSAYYLLEDIEYYFHLV